MPDSAGPTASDSPFDASSRPSIAVAAFIAEQRLLLDRLESFATTPEYGRLLAVVAPIAAGDLEPWFAEWLIHPTVGSGQLPIDRVTQPGGVDLVEQQLVRLSSGAYS